MLLYTVHFGDCIEEFVKYSFKFGYVDKAENVFCQSVIQFS